MNTLYILLKKGCFIEMLGMHLKTAKTKQENIPDCNWRTAVGPDFYTAIHSLLGNNTFFLGNFKFLRES